MRSLIPRDPVAQTLVAVGGAVLLLALVGVVSQAVAGVWQRDREPAPPPPAAQRDVPAEEREADDVARALRGMNQSYVVAPIIGRGSATGGSYYIDTTDPVHRDARSREGVVLPPPILVGPEGETVTLPRWLYGEVPPDQPVIVQPEELAELRISLEKLNAELQRLRGELETLSERVEAE